MHQRALELLDLSGGIPDGFDPPNQNLASPLEETDPLLVHGDPLTIYFASYRDGSFDIFTSHRLALDAPFDPPTKLVELNTTGDEKQAFQIDTTGPWLLRRQVDDRGNLQHVRGATPRDGRSVRDRSRARHPSSTEAADLVTS